jgi:hypothetical protein
MTPNREQEYPEEAERLAQLPREDQREILDLYRSVADNRQVPMSDRRAARDRAEALERHLRRLNRTRKKS